MTSRDVWEQRAPLFRRLFLEESKTLGEVKRIAEESYDFPRHSLSVYETKLRNLGLRKNLTPEGWVAIGQRIKSNHNHNWEVHISGRFIEKNRVIRQIGRYTKRGSHSDLPLPPEVEISWQDSFPGQLTSIPTGALLPLQPSPPVQFGPASHDSTIGHFEVVDPLSMISHRSHSGGLFLRDVMPSTTNPSVEIAMTTGYAISGDFSAAILDPLLGNLWHPILNELPARTFNDGLRQLVYNEAGSSLDAGMVSILQNTYARADPSAWSSSSPLLGMDHVLGQPPESTMTTNLDPFRILKVMVDHLSNKLEDFKEIREAILFFVKQVPHSLVVEFLQAGSPAIEACWMPLAEWSFELHQKRLFEQIMQASVRCVEWVKLHGARCLIFAAYFDCDRIVRDIIACGVSPIELVKFKINMNPKDANHPRFFGSAAVEWHRSQNVVYDTFWVKTSPLLEAAARNNKSTLGVLKDAQVNCQVRSGGLTAAGHALIAQRRGAMDVEGLFDTLSALIDMGEIIDAPLWEAGFFTSERDRGMTETNPIWSEETLLDSVYIEHGDFPSFDRLQKQSLVPSGVLTVSGILRSASGGQGDLQRYMVSSHYPKGLPRERIKEIALVRSLAIPAAFKSLMGNGFSSSLELETLLGRDNVGVGGNISLPSESDCDAITYLLDSLCELPDTVARYIIDWISKDRIADIFEWLGERTASDLPMQKLEPSQIQRLGPKLLEICLRSNDSAAVKMCLEAGISPQGIDLLDLAKIENLEGIDTDILESLYEYGARPVFSLQYLQGMSDAEGYDVKRLKWLVTHELLLDGLSIYDIIVLFNVNRVPWTELRDLGQWFATRGLCLYTWPPLTSLGRTWMGCKNSISLSLLVYLGGNVDLISQLLEGKDLDINDGRPVHEPSQLAERNWKRDSALEAAVWKCDISMIKALLHQRADIDACNARGFRTVLETSVASYVRASQSEDRAVWKEIVTYLLQRGADPNKCIGINSGKPGSPSLVLAFESPQPDLQLIQLLLDKGAHPGQLPIKDHGSLIRSISLAKMVDSKLRREILELVIARGAPYISSQELVWACILGDIELVQFYLHQRADPNFCACKSDSGLCYICKLPRRPDGSLALQLHPLEVSAAKGNIPIALILLEAGAILSDNDHSLSVASENGHLGMAALLLLHEKRLGEVKRALQSAWKSQHYSIIQLLSQRLATWTSES